MIVKKIAALAVLFTTHLTIADVVLVRLEYQDPVNPIVRAKLFTTGEGGLTSGFLASDQAITPGATITLDKGGGCVDKIVFIKKDGSGFVTFRKSEVKNFPYSGGCATVDPANVFGGKEWGNWLVKVTGPNKAVWCNVDGSNCMEGDCIEVTSELASAGVNTVTVKTEHKASDGTPICYCVSLYTIGGPEAEGIIVDSQCHGTKSDTIVLKKGGGCIQKLRIQMDPSSIKKLTKDPAQIEKYKMGFVSLRPYGTGCAGLGTLGSWFIRIKGWKNVEWCDADGKSNCTPSQCEDVTREGGSCV